MKFKNILITGGRGFIMFNGLQLWKKMFPECNFYCLDANTYADKFMQDEKNDWLHKNNIPIIEMDLSNNDAYCKLCVLVEQYHIDAIIHGAAESHVDNSITNPDIFFKSNIIGTINLLNIARKYDIRIHVVSTDEVYGETTPEDWYRDTSDGAELIEAEDKPLVPSSPYSSSKASADMIALSYHRTFGTKVTVSRCSNNAGKWQHTEKLIGTVISKALRDEKIPVYGKGNQKRHWIHVDDHNRAIMKILENDDFGKIYNIGPCHGNWITNIQLIKFILKYLGKSADLIEHVTDRLGHDTSYYIPSSDFGFKMQSYKKFMSDVIDWYKENMK